MPEKIKYFPEKQLLKITSSGKHVITESKAMIDQVVEHMTLLHPPKNVFIDFTEIKSMPNPDDLMSLAQYMVEQKSIRHLKWIILVEAGVQEDILNVTRLVAIHGFDFEFYFDRMKAKAAIGLI